MNPAPTTNRALRPILLVILGVCTLLCLIVAAWAAIDQPVYNNDFLGLWSFARFIRTQPIAGIYNDILLAAFQHRLFPGLKDYYTFPYPPSFLLATGWLGCFPYAAARALWTIIGLIALGAAVTALLPAKHRWLGVLAVLVSPASFINAIGGETGYFTAAFMIFGFAVLPTRPIIAGIAFGLMTLKPQLGLLVPFALLGGSHYRALFSAIAAIAILCVGTWAALPPDLWALWVHHLGAYQSLELSKNLSLTFLMVTITATMLELGASNAVANAAQITTACLCAGATFFTFRSFPYRQAVALIFAGSLLATPHAYIYDAIALTLALLLLVETAEITWPIILLSMVIFLAPLMTISPAAQYFYYAIPEAILYVTILRHGFATPNLQIHRL